MQTEDNMQVYIIIENNRENALILQRQHLFFAMGPQAGSGFQWIEFQKNAPTFLIICSYSHQTK